MDSEFFLNGLRKEEHLSRSMIIIILEVDNLSARKLIVESESKLRKNRTELRFFPECVTDLMQPVD